MMRDRGELLFDGQLHIHRWCDLNGVEPPRVEVKDGKDPDFGVCAYYRLNVIYIWPDACARIGMVGRQWSYPGYSTDRTPYGVLAHELGHHVECAHGARGGIFAKSWRRDTADTPLTGYCPNDNEWFAELFRLFVTNPDLLRALRPKTWALMVDRWPRLAETRAWDQVLAGADRQLQAVRNKLADRRR